MPDLLPCDPAGTLAWEEAIAVAGASACAAWAWVPDRTAAVIGLAQDAERELCTAELARDRVPVVRRASGGGAVILAEGVVCFGVLAPPEFLDQTRLEGQSAIRHAFGILTAPVVRALASWGVTAVLRGISDLALDGADRKIAGCAQLRKRAAVLVHGSLLVDVDTGIFERYLAFPSAVPGYRAGRSHTAFCCNLAEAAGAQISAGEVSGRLKGEVESSGWSWLRPDPLAASAVGLVQDKYGQEAWNLRRRRRA